MSSPIQNSESLSLISEPSNPNLYINTNFEEEIQTVTNLGIQNMISTETSLSSVPLSSYSQQWHENHANKQSSELDNNVNREVESIFKSMKLSSPSILTGIPAGALNSPYTLSHNTGISAEALDSHYILTPRSPQPPPPGWENF